MQRHKGFTLIEISMVIVVMGLLLTFLVGLSASLISQQRIQSTRQRIAGIDTALSLYVSTYRRLPCPADGRVDSATGGDEYATAGPPRTCTGNQQHGVVPWRALGLTSADVEDGWGGRFTYRVGPDLVLDNAMDFTSCDPAGTSTTAITAPPFCNPTTGGTPCNAANLANCTPPALAIQPAVKKGLVVKNVAGTVVMDPRGASGTCLTTETSTGAAYVVISHGPEGGGAYGSAGTLLGSAVAAGTMEATNFADLAYAPPVCGVPPTSVPPTTSYLVDDVINTVGATHFDDVVSRPNILTVATRAQVGPRAR